MFVNICFFLSYSLLVLFSCEILVLGVKIVDLCLESPVKLFQCFHIFPCSVLKFPCYVKIFECHGSVNLLFSGIEMKLFVPFLLKYLVVPALISYIFSCYISMITINILHLVKCFCFHIFSEATSWILFICDFHTFNEQLPLWRMERETQGHIGRCFFEILELAVYPTWGIEVDFTFLGFFKVGLQNGIPIKAVYCKLGIIGKWWSERCWFPWLYMPPLLSCI